jgi:hypothetical protein
MCNIYLGTVQALPAIVAGDVNDRNADCAAFKTMATEDSPPPKIFYPEWQKKYEAALLELDREKLAERSQPQKPLSMSGFRKFRKNLIIKPRGRPLKTQCQASAFLSGTIWVFRTGKRSDHAASR